MKLKLTGKKQISRDVKLYVDIIGQGCSLKQMLRQWKILYQLEVSISGVGNGEQRNKESGDTEKKPFPLENTDTFFLHWLSFDKPLKGYWVRDYNIVVLKK